MLRNRKQYSVVGQLDFKNKLTEKEIRFVVIRAGLGEGEWKKAVKSTDLQL